MSEMTIFKHYLTPVKGTWPSSAGDTLAVGLGAPPRNGGAPEVGEVPSEGQADRRYHMLKRETRMYTYAHGVWLRSREAWQLVQALDPCFPERLHVLLYSSSTVFALKHFLFRCSRAVIFRSIGHLKNEALLLRP
jgi:hypothetical protein